MSGARAKIVVVADVGSTFTKVSVVDERAAAFVSHASTPTTHDDLGAGLAHALREAVSNTETVEETFVCSSAAGGLRVAVVGFEPQLTLEAGRRAATTAGGRIVATFSGVLRPEDLEELVAARADLVLLVGGTNGGDRSVIEANAAAILEAASPEQAIVVAGNEDAYVAIEQHAPPGRIIRFAPNVLPRVGELAVGGARREIRELFVAHVIGRGRLSYPPGLARLVRMPTPSAVLEGARVLAQVGEEEPEIARPAVVDVGGATTDVHSVLPYDPHARTYGREVVPDDEATRTVEGDLGVRENADSLVVEALRAGYLDAAEATMLREPAVTRARDRAFVAQTTTEVEIDRRLAQLAAALALARHAGSMSVTLSDDGATLRMTGRDLRGATCVVASGGVLEREGGPTSIITGAIALAAAQRALVPIAAPVLVDSTHALAAAGLLAASRPRLAAALLRRELTDGRFARVA